MLLSNVSPDCISFATAWEDEDEDDLFADTDELEKVIRLSTQTEELNQVPQVRELIENTMQAVIRDRAVDPVPFFFGPQIVMARALLEKIHKSLREMSTNTNGDASPLSSFTGVECLIVVCALAHGVCFFC